MTIIKLRLCHNNTVLIFVIRTISIILTHIQIPVAKGVWIIEVPLYVCMYVCMYVCIYCVWGYICGQKMGCLGSYTTGKFLISVIYSRSSSLMTKKGAYYSRRFILRKKFGTILLTGQKNSSGKL